MSTTVETARRTEKPRATPDFLVGRNRVGQWLAVASDGLKGGIFASREAALRFAASECAAKMKGVRLTRRPIDLTI